MAAALTHRVARCPAPTTCDLCRERPAVLRHVHAETPEAAARLAAGESPDYRTIAPSTWCDVCEECDWTYAPLYWG